MLSYEEHQTLFRLGEYSPVTSSSQYGGLNPDWIRPQRPQPPYSEPLARQPLNPPAKSFKPLSATATTRPSDLDNKVLVDDNTPPRLRPARNYSHNFQTPSKQPPKRNAPETFNASDLSDSSTSDDANFLITQVDPPTIEVKDRDDDELSDGEAGAAAERNFTLSSPMKQNLGSDVSYFPSLIEISDDFDI